MLTALGSIQSDDQVIAHDTRDILKGVVRWYCLCRSRLRSCVIYWPRLLRAHAAGSRFANGGAWRQSGHPR